MILIRAFEKVALLLAIVFILTANPCAPAQSRGSLPVKFDEFGDIEASDLIARLDNFAIQLQNQPASKGFLIVYRTRRDLPGLSNRYAHYMKSYLLHSRGVSADRLVTVDGGVSSCLWQEVWIVPPGTAPVPREVYSNSYQASAYKFDEHFYSLPNDPEVISYWGVPPHELLGHLEAFAHELQKNKQFTGYLIAFKTAGRDAANVSRGMLRKEKDFLVKEFGIEPSRIKTVDGGYREWRTMELWITNNGGAVPIVTTFRPSPGRRKH